MNKWEELKEYIKKDIEASDKDAENDRLDKSVRKMWRNCAWTASYILEYMLYLERLEKKEGK